MNWDFIYRGETKHLDDAARASATGCFIKLSDGYTHYELDGPPRYPAVVLVHGFSVPYFIWDPTFQALTAAGWRVLRYDLFGRGYSDRPNLEYNIDLFVRQLRELLEALRLEQVNLIGLSMGGAIASAYTVGYAACVHKLALIDPIGTQAMPLNLLYRTAVLPGISEMLLGLAGTETMVKSVACDFFDRAYIEKFQDQYRIQLQYRGFKRAILSTLRNKMVEGFPVVYAQLGKQNIPVLLIWGRNDTTLPLGQSQSILTFVPRAELHVIENAGHIPHFEKHEIVSPILLDFLNSQ